MGRQPVVVLVLGPDQRGGVHVPNPLGAGPGGGTVVRTRKFRPRARAPGPTPPGPDGPVPDPADGAVAGPRRRLATVTVVSAAAGTTG